VESIPFTETREYVQAILRNVSLYRRIYSEPPQERVAINHGNQ
jgi:soluble lytic murein transglycosylase-like protein